MTAITGGLITLEYAATGLQYKNLGLPANAARDADLIAYVQAATPVIEDIAGAQSVKTFTKNWNGGVSAIVLPGAVTAITQVIENGAVTTDYLWDQNSQILYAGIHGQREFAEGYTLGVSVTYTVGSATVPMNVQLATRELVRFWVQQGMNAQRPGFGDGAEVAAWTPQGFAVPKRVMELLASSSVRRLGGFA